MPGATVPDPQDRPTTPKSPFSAAWQWRITMPVVRGHRREECRAECYRSAQPVGRARSAFVETKGEDAMYVLEARDLRKAFGEGEAAVEALKGVNMGVQPGEMLAIMGRSGSGKSTMLTLLGGVDVPTSGHVLLEGTDLASLDDDGRTLIRRRRIGFVFQAFNLLPILTAEENVALPLELDGVPSNIARERAIKTLELVGLAGRLTRRPGKMSGGEQQPVAIARALVIEPAIVLADEPTGNLDSSNSKRITQALRELVDQHGQTIVMVTHDPAVAEQADRVVFLLDGEIEREETNRVVPVRPRRVPTGETARVS